MQMLHARLYKFEPVTTRDVIHTMSDDKWHMQLALVVTITAVVAVTTVS